MRRIKVLSRFILLAATATPLFVQPPAHAQSIPEPVHFDPTAVVDVIRISRADCATLEAKDTAIWVKAGEKAACLRYYSAGLRRGAGTIQIAAIWMNGDVLGPKGTNAGKRQSGFGPTEMVDLEQRLSARFGIPAIFLGRPGTYGSSGKHYSTRGRPIEAQLISATLDGLRERYRIQSWALGGHSGGGTLVAEMLARRRDLRCAVISSGAAAYRAYLETRGLLKPGKKLERFDPSASLDKVPKDPTRRIFIIGDPRETNVPFSSQKLYFDGLVRRGHAAWLIPLERATDARHHNLVEFGETANMMCAADAGTDRIISTLKVMPEQGPRLSN